jgi:hypothetical protein
MMLRSGLELSNAFLCRNKTTMLSWVFQNSDIKRQPTRSRSLVRFHPHKSLVLFLIYDTSIDRKKVLKHHPDKKAASTGAPASDTAAALLGINVSQNTNDDAFFKCIQKAHEVLTNPEKRRQFDSVDPAFMEEEEEKAGITASEFKVGLLLITLLFFPTSMAELCYNTPFRLLHKRHVLTRLVSGL